MARTKEYPSRQRAKLAPCASARAASGRRSADLRAEAARAPTEQERAARSRAETRVRDAAEHARRIAADAEERVEVSRRVRSRIAALLRAVDRLLSDTAPSLSEPEDDPRPVELIPLQERALTGCRVAEPDAAARFTLVVRWGNPFQ
ncbi:hypothetical protein [Lentzea aerocolonigenes]|uniref:hypothetical protein n=1 Tax=Lentzea aerocolonigenes TaxID=68170 RepID=UPI0004C2B6EE|nr:hypothetical protein [Lentzea aerocolonigenes]MCP2241750.1 hypothetical protein [Lentzea aerocolonigenes]